MDDGPTTLTYVTLGIAGWGALLSTVLAVRQVRRDRRRVHVIVSPVLQMYRKDDGSFDGRHVLTVDAINDGHRPVEIVRHGVFTVGGHHFIAQPIDPMTAEPERPLPKLLQDGDRVTIHYDCADLEDDFRAAGVWVEDSQGKTYRKRVPGVANIVRLPLARARWGFGMRVRAIQRWWERRREARRSPPS